MLFSSHPAYLDPPNWQQLLDPQQQGHNNEFFQLPPLPPTSTHHVSGHGISIRSISMSDQARMSIVPQPDGPLKCPRCESTNTKFCYFNNYSLSQPRHFCKTCRRYWTRGGALRNVPVGGGYRKNKKSKNSSSKSTSSNARTIPSGCFSQQPQSPFMASLQNFTSFGIGNSELNRTNLKLSGFQGPLEVANYYSGQPKEHAFGGNNSLFAAAGFDAPTRFYSSIQSETVSAVEPFTKMDGNQELKLLRHFGESNQFYGGIHGQNYQV